MATDTKAIVEDFKTTWAQMKAALDDARAEYTKAGNTFGETEAKLNKMSDRMDELETRLKRMPLSAALADEDETKARAREQKRIFFETLKRGSVALLDEEDKARAREWKIGPVGASEAKALSLGDDTLGGFLAPPEFVTDIIKGVQLISPIRGLATIRNTTRRSIMYPVRSGVFAAQWIGETATRSETTGLTYSMEEIPTYEMYAEVLVSEQDLEDSAFDLEAEIRDNAAEQFAKAEGTAFVAGDSMKKPEGFMTNANVAIDLSGLAGKIASAAAGSAGQGDGLIGCAYNLKSAYVPGAVWVMNRKSVGIVRKLADSQGRYLWEPNYQAGTASGYLAGSTSTLLGVPIVEAPDMQDEGASNFPIMFGNLKRAYLLVDRVDMVVKRLNEKYAEQGQIAFIVRKRVGGQVVLPEAIRKYKSNNS